MAAGDGTDSRIYRTTDGGQTWTLVFQNTDPNAFYDCMTFFNKKVGLALSDPPDGVKFRILKTTDNGRTWSVVDPAGMPPALTGEFAFAASGQCITSNHGRSAWFGTGGSAQARVFTSRNRGRTWSVSATPMNSGPTAGINALAFRSQQHGLAVGGDFAVPATSPTTSQPPATAAARGRCSPVRRPSTAPERPGSTATPRSRSGLPAATSRGTRAGPGPVSTRAASTPWTARTRTPAGPRARAAAPRTSSAR